MSNELATIVRPSTALDFAPAKVYYQPGQAGNPAIILRFGRGGTGKVLQGGYQATSTYYCTAWKVEKKNQLAAAGYTNVPDDQLSPF